jgi:hypothetical protein
VDREARRNGPRTPRRRGRRAAAADVFRGDELLADLQAAVDAVADELPEERLRPGPSGPPGGPPRPLDKACALLLETVRRRCPGLLPAAPLPAGDTAEPVQIDAKHAAALVNLAARQAALTGTGAPVGGDADRLPRAVLWREGTDALLVEVGALDVTVGAGLVTVTVPVRCDQVHRGRAVVSVELVVGSPERPAGLLAATSEPRGPPVVVRRWADALTALAWQALLDAAGALASATGRDADGTPLVPVALTANDTGLALLAQARHPIDRVRQGSVVLADGAPGTARR